MSSGSGASDEISSLAQNCWEPWAEILAQPGHTYGSRGLVQEYQQRYEAWIVFLGVFANGSLSLDHRLRNSFEIKSMVLQQLQVLNRNLKAVSKLFEKMQENELVQDDGVKIPPTLEAVFCGVEDALNRLHRLGVAIRDASAGQLMSRIKPLSKDRRVSSFEKMAYSIIATLYRSANPRLLEHVSASLALKYQVIIYRQGREKEYRVLPGQHVQKLPRPTALSYRQEHQAELKIASRPQVGKQETDVGRVGSSTISSTFDEQEFKKQQLQTHRAPGPLRPSVTSIHIGPANCPPQPIISGDAKYAKCDWCLENLPASLFKTQPEWRKHVQRDWKPYICVSEDCANLTPVPSFAKASEWERHMQAQHGDDWPRTVYKPPTWICDLDHPDIDETETPRFTTDAELATHIRGSHEGISSDEIQTMVRYNTVLLSRAADVCPFCCYTVEDDPKQKNAAAGWSGDKLTASRSTTSSNIYTIPEESEDKSPISRASKHMYCHVAEHLNNFTVLMIRMISVPDGSGDAEGEESVVFSESSSVGDNKSNYQNWESSTSEAEDEYFEPRIPYSDPIVQKSYSDEAIGTGVKHTADEDYVSETSRNILPEYYIPLRRNENFVGRKDVLEMLKKMLFGDNNSRKVALVGLGGVGKTQVALEVAYWAKDHQPDYSILWISAISNDSVNQAYTEIAKQLAVQIDHEQGLKESLRRHLDSKKAGKFLLIVDNADDPDILLGSSNNRGGLYDYLPESEDSLILLTTRSRDTAIGVSASNVIGLHDMSQEEATALLYGTLINKELLDDKRGTEKLLRELVYFPLAIVQAAAYLNQNRTSITDYLVLLHNRKLSLISGEPYDTTRYQEHLNAVATTLMVSFSLICRSNSHAATLLSFMSCIEAQAIPESIFPQPRIKEEIISAIGILCRYGFLVRRGMDSMFDMHPLVHSATRVWVQNQHIVKDIRTKAIQHLISVFSSSKKEDLLRRKEYLPHAQHALWISKDDQSAGRFDLLYYVGLCLYAERRVEDAIIALEETYRFRKQYLPEESNIRLASERALGRAYLENRRIKEAVKLFQHVVDTRKMTSQSIDDRFTSERELAWAYYEDRQTGKSIEILERHLLVEKDSLTETNGRLESEELLASAYVDARRTKEAIRILERVVFFQKKTLAEGDRVRLKTESVLASAYIDNSQNEEATRILENAQILWHKTAAADDHDRLTSEQLLAYAYLDSRQTNKAIWILENVVSIRVKTLKVDDPERLTSEHELAYAYMQIGRFKDAITILKHVVLIERKMDMSENQRRVSRDLLAEAQRSA